MTEHKDQFRLQSMCRVLRVQRSGYNARKQKQKQKQKSKLKSKSKRTLIDESLLLKIRQSFERSQSIYGSSRARCNLREDRVLCEENRIAPLMRQA